MPLTPIGLNIPAGTDAFDPQVDFSDLAGSLVGRTVVPVANTTERAALAAAVPPSASRPLVVFRADASLVRSIEWSIDGTNWYAAADSLTLPAPIQTNGPGAQNVNITAAVWANMPAGNFAVPLTLPRAAWVQIDFSTWIVKTSTSDLRIGVALTGATVLLPEEPQWSTAIYAGANFAAYGGQQSARKTVLYNAGTTTATMRAYLAATGGTNVANYTQMTITPLRWQ